MSQIFGVINTRNNQITDNNPKLPILKNAKKDDKDLKYFDFENFSVGTCHIRKNYLDFVNDILIVIDGQIYNKESLAEEVNITKKDFDIEYLLSALYLKYGINFIKKLDGTFSLFLFDKKNSSFFIARDKMGVRPLYYSIKDGILFFSSKIKYFYNNEHINLDIDRKSLKYFFDLRFIPSPNTIFKNISKLDAGQYIEIKNSNFKFKYFNKYTILNNKKITKENFQTVSNEYMNLFNEAVETSVFDNDYSVFLSGGLDSASVSSVLNSFLIKNIIPVCKIYP